MTRARWLSLVQGNTGQAPRPRIPVFRSVKEVEHSYGIWGTEGCGAQSSSTGLSTRAPCERAVGTGAAPGVGLEEARLS